MQHHGTLVSCVALHHRGMMMMMISSSGCDQREAVEAALELQVRAPNGIVGKVEARRALLRQRQGADVRLGVAQVLWQSAFASCEDGGVDCLLLFFFFFVVIIVIVAAVTIQRGHKHVQQQVGGVRLRTQGVGEQFGSANGEALRLDRQHGGTHEGEVKRKGRRRHLLSLWSTSAAMTLAYTVAALSRQRPLREGPKSLAKWPSAAAVVAVVVAICLFSIEWHTGTGPRPTPSSQPHALHVLASDPLEEGAACPSLFLPLLLFLLSTSTSSTSSPPRTRDVLFLATDSLEVGHEAHLHLQRLRSPRSDTCLSRKSNTLVRYASWFVMPAIGMDSRTWRFKASTASAKASAPLRGLSSPKSSDAARGPRRRASGPRSNEAFVVACRCRRPWPANPTPHCLHTMRVALPFLTFSAMCSSK